MTESTPPAAATRWQRIGLIITLILSTLVIVWSVLGLIGLWTAGAVVSDIATTVLKAGEEFIQVGKTVIVKLEDRIGQFDERLGALQADVQQVANNLTDEELVRVLLPDSVEEQVLGAFTDIQDAIQQARDTLAAIADVGAAVRRLPFVDLPQTDDGLLSTVGGVIDKVGGLVDGIAQGVSKIREGTAEAIGLVAELIGQVSLELGKVLTWLGDLYTDLEALQFRLFEIRTILPLALILVLALVVSPPFVWIVGTQVYVLRRARDKYRMLKAQDSAAAPIAPAAATAALPDAAAPASPDEPSASAT